MSSHTIQQQNQQLHHSPLPPPFISKSTLLSGDSRLTSFCTSITDYYNYDPPYLQITCNNISLAPSRALLDPYKFALYNQDFNNFQKIQDTGHALYIPITLKPNNIHFNYLFSTKI